MSATRVHATDVECPVCGAWIGWACEGRNYGYHAAGYHPTRQRAAERAAGITTAKDPPRAAKIR